MSYDQRDSLKATLAAGLIALALVSLVPVRAADAPTLAQLLAQAGEHVRRFQLEFATIVSDEDYRQHVFSRQYSTPPPASFEDVERLPSTSRQRRTRSEMLFLWMPDETAWLTVRNVLTVDGRPVPDSQNRLSDALGDASVERRTRLRRLLNESARFNLGSIYRNLNFPTLALLYLDPALQSRFTFTSAGRARINGVEAEKIGFDERSRPTFIQDNGADLVSRGAMWVADADGTVVRTRLELRIPLRETVVSVEVDYRRDARLGMWVPWRMHETYEHSRESALVESIDCVATYSNFRRFETSGRVIFAEIEDPTASRRTSAGSRPARSARSQGPRTAGSIRKPVAAAGAAAPARGSRAGLSAGDA